MTDTTKTSQLQIRVTAIEKAEIQRAAKQLNLDMSSYVLARVLPRKQNQLQNLLNELVVTDDSRYVLSEINTLLSRLTARECKASISIILPSSLSDYLSNYIAAMVEFVCNQHKITLPNWTKNIQPLSKPKFGSELLSLRLYLLTHSPAAFRRRNIFVDTTIGGQV